MNDIEIPEDPDYAILEAILEDRQFTFLNTTEAACARFSHAVREFNKCVAECFLKDVQFVRRLFRQ